MRPCVKHWSAQQRRKTKIPLNNHFKKVDSSKNALVFKTAIMITVLTKWSQYRGLQLRSRSSQMPYFWLLRLWQQSSQNNCSHISEDCDPHKNVMLLSLYEDWDHCDHDRSMHKNILYLRFCEDRDHDRNPHKMPYFSLSPHRTHHEHEQNEICKKVDLWITLRHGQSWEVSNVKCNGKE